MTTGQSATSIRNSLSNVNNTWGDQADAAAARRVAADAQAKGINPYTSQYSRPGAPPIYNPNVVSNAVPGQGAGTVGINRANNISNLASSIAGRAPTVARPGISGTSTSTAVRRGGGGGGGGGAVAAPKLSQAQLDWMASLLKSAGPQALTANTLDLPDYQAYAYAAFDPSMYNQLQGSFDQAVQMDRNTATQSYGDLTNWLNQNQTNAFNNGNNSYAQADPQQQAMARMLQDQGVNAASNPGFQSSVQGAAAGNAAFDNLWRVLGANEDTANRNRLGNVQQQAAQTQNGLNVAALQGTTGIGLQRSQAQAAYQTQLQQMQREDWQAQQQALQQEALANWQRANEVQDTNSTNINSYRNSELQSLLGLLPSLAGNPAALPSLQALGLA